MKNVAAMGAVEPDEAEKLSGLPDEVQVALCDIAAVAGEGLLGLSVSAGLAVMAEMMQAELTPLCHRGTCQGV
jgi:hypothetical protein